MIARHKYAAAYCCRDHNRRITAQAVRLSKGAFYDNAEILAAVWYTANTHQRLRRCGMNLISGQQDRNRVIFAIGEVEHRTTYSIGVLRRLTPLTTCPAD